MNADLDATLAELGGDYREMTRRMCRAMALRPRFRPQIFGGAAALLAASFALVLALRHSGGGGGSSMVPNEYALASRGDRAAVAEILRTQNPEGGWRTDFLTRRNLAALQASDAPEAVIACKKARRNLRARGLFLKNTPLRNNHNF